MSVRDESACSTDKENRILKEERYSKNATDLCEPKAMRFKFIDGRRPITRFTCSAKPSMSVPVVIMIGVSVSTPAIDLVFVDQHPYYS